MKYDVSIIGGGIVGLATALKIQAKNPKLKIVVLEKEAGLAKHQTGNNSGVIHSGLYYKPGSLKARNCLQGYKELVEFCQKEEIPFELTGKVVVATREEQKPLLENLRKRGLENGLEGTRSISLEELREFEPHCHGVAAIHVPQTGIVDYYQVALAYGRKFIQNGGEIKYSHKVLKINRSGGKIVIITSESVVETNLVVNCAGLYSDKIAEMTSGMPSQIKIIPFRGEYYKLTPEKEYLVKNLIYPVPDPNFPFLGVHFTRMKKGGVEAGPNAVLAFKREGYKKSQIDLSELGETLAWPGFQKVAAKYWQTGFGELYRSFSKGAFTKALQELIPEVQESDLMEGGAGVRAQACDKKGGLLDDFAIEENDIAINVLNAPSPAATSSLAIGGTISEMVMKRLS
ncbi:L-2-hydroxyglutarate oxidase [Algoriphagus sediminis]|uniref:L-2-hydroxyglutarate oxidase n=1 Tax=Algoriphagus sediminis TaxID=3057113 RepID=A0ABT7YCV7_9BACT|nr:L-2-hydroxyglutarate oxidase [Algoriphagus sediminis]MDN3204366.1 L-2-hydroxyglutarate oxidase [Algoriphagus sediminis]